MVIMAEMMIRDVVNTWITNAALEEVGSSSRSYRVRIILCRYIFAFNTKIKRAAPGNEFVSLEDRQLFQEFSYGRTGSS